MRRLAVLALLVPSLATAGSGLKYPETRKADVADDYFGTRVEDPYRWLEDDNSEETKAWVEAQNAVTYAYLGAIPERERIRRKLTALWNYERYSAPIKRGSRYFYSRNDGLQNQSVWYVTEGLAEAGRVLLDPNTLSSDGTVAVSGFSVTDDGALLAYGLAESGSDWVTWRVRDVATGRDLPDEVRWTKFGTATWLKDGSGFIYSRLDPPGPGTARTAVNKNRKLFLHRLGTSQDQDTLVYARPDQPDWGFSARITDDGRWLAIYQSEGTERRNRIYLKDLREPGATVEPFLDSFDASYSIEGNDGETFYVHTDKDAPRFRLVAIEKGRPEPKDWRTILPEGPGRDVMDGVSLVADRFVVEWSRDAHASLRVYALDGKPGAEIPLPAIGSVSGFSGRRAHREGFFSFTSFAYPPSVYRYDFTTGTSEVFKQPKVAFDPAEFETRQVFYASKDGTKVPMFVVHKKGLKRDGQRPTYLYGYGGFSVSLGPAFSPAHVAWMEMGGVFAQPNLRGGGEYGKQWHDAGRLANKQNVFDDFIAAAEWLIANQYTSTPKLAIGGGSNGGLLVGACMTQRPDLFGVALPAVGVMDMLRFHRFTIGWAWKSDYGSSETKEGFDTLIRYSPLHALRPGTRYPATLVTTADHDDRVVPAHSHKFTARLQACQAGDAPVLTRIETKAGHGAGKPTTKAIEERADIWAFAVKNLGMTLPEGF
jgi:prolyl oligopeptidase